MVQMAFCDLSHTYHKQVTNVSPACFCQPTLGNFDVSHNVIFYTQSSGSRFNRGMLMNAGVVWAKKAGLICDCIIIHDVDHVPEDDRNMYFCQHKPIHLAVARNDHKYT